MFSSSQGGAQYLPLGPRFEFPMVQDADAHKHPTKRRYLFNMMASLDTHPDRKALHDRLTAAVAEANQRREGGGDGGATKSSASGAVEDTGSLPLLSSGYAQNFSLPLAHFLLKRYCSCDVLTKCRAACIFIHFHFFYLFRCYAKFGHQVFAQCCQLGQFSPDSPDGRSSGAHGGW